MTKKKKQGTKALKPVEEGEKEPFPERKLAYIISEISMVLNASVMDITETNIIWEIPGSEESVVLHKCKHGHSHLIVFYRHGSDRKLSDRKTILALQGIAWYNDLKFEANGLEEGEVVGFAE